MTFAICSLSVVPVRNAASDKSEQVTQLLFGEIVEILETKGKQWSKVRCTWDNCIGWVSSLQIQAITDSEHKDFSANFAFNLDLISPLMSNKHHLPITIGARLPNFDGIRFNLAERSYTFSGQAVFPTDLSPNAEMILKLAKRYLMAPYQWGGRSPLGIDASGLTQMVFQLVGIHLHREPNQQVHQGETVDFVEQSQPGDLAFFENKAGNITHVGIIMPDRHLIHVSGQVRIDKVDHYGIFNEETGRYTHRLRVAKRMLPKMEIGPDVSDKVNTPHTKQVELF